MDDATVGPAPPARSPPRAGAGNPSPAAPHAYGFARNAFAIVLLAAAGLKVQSLIAPGVAAGPPSRWTDGGTLLLATAEWAVAA